MRDASQPTRRPLDAGELLDRTVTLIVHRWASFLGILATVFVPLTIMQSFSTGGWRELLAALAAARTAGPGANEQMGRVLAASHLGPLDYATFAVLLLVMPIVVAAVMSIASSAYDGSRATTAQALALGVRRWPVMVLFALTWAVLFGIALFAYVFLSALALTGLIVGIGHGTNPRAAVTVGLIAGGMDVGFAVVAAGLLYITVSLAFAAALFETANPFVAMSRSVARVFAKRELLRASLLSVTLIFISYAVAIFGMVVGSLAYWLTHVYATLVVLAQIGALVAYAFNYTLITVYYRDLRLRREGGDLLELASSAQPAVAP